MLPIATRVTAGALEVQRIIHFQINLVAPDGNVSKVLMQESLGHVVGGWMTVKEMANSLDHR